MSRQHKHRLAFLITVWSLLLATEALWGNEAWGAEPRVHVVQQGQSLGRIAKRYSVSVDDLCKANQLDRRKPIHPGQRLVVPQARSSSCESAPVQPTPEPAPADRAKEKLLHVPGIPPSYYYEPQTSSGRRPVMLYLHGRGGEPRRDCARLAPLARRFGWLICPGGPGLREDGGRTWNNNWPAGRHIATKSLSALQQRYPQRVQRNDNVLIGFSEGAFVAMNVGLWEPATFSRWLILAADTKYWGAPGLHRLKQVAPRVQRVVLLTGQLDGVHDSTRRVHQHLLDAGVNAKLQQPSGVGHHLAVDSHAALYADALRWLTQR